MTDAECVAFLQWALPRLRLRWPGFRRVRGQVRKRLARRLGALGLPSLAAYRERLEADPSEWPVLDGLCRITISRFYRDKLVFETLGMQVLPALARQAAAGGRSVRCWSAGCASGEEAYSLKILWDLDVRHGRPKPGMEVTGTDAGEDVLERARRGCYGAGSLKDAPGHWLEHAFETRDRLRCVRDRHRAGVEFACQDIRREGPEGPFDLVLCRNLAFTYFEPDLQLEILGRIAATLRAGAYIVIGAHERLPDAHGFEPLAETPSVLRMGAAIRALPIDGGQ
ncbi:MAG: CheR family methyltransferase [Methyloligellaceae bacterium]